MRRPREVGIAEKRRADLVDMRNALVAKKRVHSYGERWFVTKTNPSAYKNKPISVTTYAPL